MCGIHTIYHTLCGCYSKPKIYGEPCIRAVKGAGLSNGCWHKDDLGVDSEDSVCRRCLSPGSRSGSLSSTFSFSFGSGYESDASSLAGSRRVSDAESVSSATTVAERVGGQEEVSFKMLAEEEGSVWLTVRAGHDTAGTLKRVDSTNSFSSISTMISAWTSAEHAQILKDCLPEKIHTTTRNASGVAISYWKIGPGVERGEGENMHWRMYDDRRYERT
jgi:hypothetical protein